MFEVAQTLTMNKTQLQAKLFLFYLWFKKPIIIFSAIVTIAAIGLDNWERSKYITADRTPWKLVNVETGDRFIVTRHNKTKTISLCGVSEIENVTKQYLTSVINLGGGTVELEQIKNSYEAWVSLKPGYDVELVKHVSNKPNELVGQEIHLNTWVIERGEARQDTKEASQCREPEHLVWAETIAKKGKFGIWQDKKN